MKNRNGALDILKFLFAVEVVFYHGDFGENHFRSGYLATDFFFIVTGILFARTAMRYQVPDAEIGKDTASFMKRKILNLMPNYYVAWVICFVIRQIHDQCGLRQSMVNFAKSYGELLLVSSTGMKDYMVNGPMWYISSMLFALLLLYPLAKKLKENFLYLAAPILFFFLMGFTFQNYEALYQDARYGICSGTILRAVMMISLGCICYKIGEKLAARTFSKGERIAISVAELVIYLMIFGYMDVAERTNKLSWLLIYLMGAGATLTYSKAGYLTEYLDGNVATFLGEYSYNCYLAHWAMLQLVYSITWLTHAQKGVIYLVASAANALFVMYVSKGLRVGWKKLRGQRV